MAREWNARSWSIYPFPGSLIGWPKVIIEFHSWPEMGLCNFQKPIGKKRYWFDVREQPRWMTGEQLDPRDADGHFDHDA